jgi:3',5'-nucleoside bisphosphate phosphatase
MNLDFEAEKEWVDLHTHSLKSDGTVSPSQLISKAAEAKIKYLSITDHDSVEGLRELRVDPPKIKHYDRLALINGVELSAEHSGGVMHILGYGIDIDSPLLLSSLRKFQIRRKDRNTKILKKLESVGIKITADQLATESGPGSQGRPHIAQLLMRKGIVDSIDEAFKVFLSKGGKAFVQKELFPVQQAISLIHETGGLAVLAHPVTLNLDSPDFDIFLDKLIGHGLNGLEVYASLHSRDQTAYYNNLAMKKNLLVSAGSDFHGDFKPDIKLGECFQGQRISKNQISHQIIENAKLVETMFREI